MFAIIANLHTHEDEPRYSAFDPYIKTTFGQVACDLIVGEQTFTFSACTADRCADSFFLDGEHYDCDRQNYRSLYMFCGLLFNAQNGQKVELPFQLAALCK